jgi:uncharacterized protein YecE (DUF72 family)
MRSTIAACPTTTLLISLVRSVTKALSRVTSSLRARTSCMAKSGEFRWGFKVGKTNLGRLGPGRPVARRETTEGWTFFPCAWADPGPVQLILGWEAKSLLPRRSSGKQPERPMQVYCGVSGFSYAEWKGGFYPKGLRPGEMLAFYAKHLSTTELNNTFYRMPKDEQFEAWAGEVPGDFRFAVKAPRLVTHIKRLNGVDAPTADFLARVKQLGSRLGPVLFQLPPNLKLDLPRLDGFLEVLGAVPFAHSLRVAVEFRHPSWFVDAVLERFAVRNISLVIGDDDELESPPLVRTASFCYVRLRKTAPYSAAELDAWAGRLLKLGAGELFMYFKHEPHAPEQAAQFRARFSVD